jgi:hypothetical protein
MGKIIPFPVQEAAKARFAAHGESLARQRSVESALQRPEHILIAWARESGLLNTIRGWYLPRDGKRWVYHWHYDGKTMKEIDMPARYSCAEIYRWLTEESEKGFFSEFHICASPFILLDFKELRQEYLDGKLDYA